MRYVHNLSVRALKDAFEKGQGVRHAQLCCRLARQGKTDLLSAIGHDVLGDDWLDFTYESLGAYFQRSAGTVYIVSTPAYPGLVKVGKTQRSVQERLQSLNNESVVLPFVANEAIRVHDRHWVEVCAHRVLKAQGLHQHKEFFSTSSEHASAVIRQAADTDKRIFQSMGLYTLDSLL